MGLSTPKFRCNTSKKFRRKKWRLYDTAKTIPFFLQVGIISVQGSTQRPLATALAFRSSGLTTTELLRLVVAQSLRLYGSTRTEHCYAVLSAPLP